MRPIIGIGAKVVVNENMDWTPWLMGVDYTYRDAVLRAGGTPIIIPVLEDRDMQRQIYEMCDGILLTGGNDLDPQLLMPCPAQKRKNTIVLATTKRLN